MQQRCTGPRPALGLELCGSPRAMADDVSQRANLEVAAKATTKMHGGYRSVTPSRMMRCRARRCNNSKIGRLNELMNRRKRQTAESTTLDSGGVRRAPSRRRWSTQPGTTCCARTQKRRSLRQGPKDMVSSQARRDSADALNQCTSP